MRAISRIGNKSNISALELLRRLFSFGKKDFGYYSKSTIKIFIKKAGISGLIYASITLIIVLSYYMIGITGFEFIGKGFYRIDRTILERNIYLGYSCAWIGIGLGIYQIIRLAILPYYQLSEEKVGKILPGEISKKQKRISGMAERYGRPSPAAEIAGIIITIILLIGAMYYYLEYRTFLRGAEIPETDYILIRDSDYTVYNIFIMIFYMPALFICLFLILKTITDRKFYGVFLLYDMILPESTGRHTLISEQRSAVSRSYVSEPSERKNEIKKIHSLSLQNTMSLTQRSDNIDGLSELTDKNNTESEGSTKNTGGTGGIDVPEKDGTIALRKENGGVTVLFGGDRSALSEAGAESDGGSPAMSEYEDTVFDVDKKESGSKSKKKENGAVNIPPPGEMTVNNYAIGDPFDTEKNSVSVKFEIKKIKAIIRAKKKMLAEIREAKLRDLYGKSFRKLKKKFVEYMRKKGRPYDFAEYPLNRLIIMFKNIDLYGIAEISDDEEFIGYTPVGAGMTEGKSERSGTYMGSIPSDRGKKKKGGKYGRKTKDRYDFT